MNAEDMYYDHPDLMTPEELEDLNLNESANKGIPTFTPKMRSWLIDSVCDNLASPEAATRREFERRPPALGVTKDLLDEIRVHEKRLKPVQQRKIYGHIRSSMLRHLIPCPGARTADELLDILQKELDSGVPAPIPTWYRFSTVTMGPRKIGYDHCENRSCFETENVDKHFYRCSGCKLPYYCSKNCQKEDWKARHKKICKAAAEQREQVKKAGNLMQALSDMSLSGQGSLGGNGMESLAQMVKTAKTNPAVKQRRKMLKKEKKRPIGQKPEGPDPDFF